MLNKRTASMVLAGALALGAAHGQELTEPYAVEVWANVLFGTDGKLLEYALVDEAKYPARFIENVKARVAQARIKPPEDGGRPMTLRTGVRLNFEVAPDAEGGGQVRISGLSMAPLPIKRYYASYPKDVGRTGGWVGAVEGLCKVGIDGHCSSIEVKALPGMPDSVRRYARVSLEGWSFAPQEVDGKPVEGEYLMRLRLNTLDTRPENFKQDKFLKILRSREREF